MRNGWAPALALVLLLPSASALVSLDASFTTPATLEGRLEANPSWALFVFRKDPASSFHLELVAPGTVTNHTRLWDEQQTPLTRTSTAYPVPDRQEPLGGEVSGRLSFDAFDWGSLYLEADRIGLHSRDARATLETVKHPDWADSHLPDHGIPPSSWHVVPLSPGQVAAGVDGGPKGFPFILEASGLRRVVWHNVALDCAASCVGGGQPSGVSFDHYGRISYTLHSYVDVAARSGTLQGQGISLAAAMGGPTVDVSLDGSARLPQASLTGTCGRNPCPDPAGKTFLASGNLTFATLAPDPQQPLRLRAGLSGTFEDAAFDEEPTSAFKVPAALLASLFGIGVLAWVAKVLHALWTGFSRRTRPPALHHPRRQAIHDLVCAEPGLSFRALQRRLGIPVGALQRHLARMLDEDLLVSQRHRNTVRYFHRDHARTQAWQAPLRDADAKRLYEWLASHQEVPQADLARHTHGWGWSLAKLRRRLALLQEAGLVGVRRRGGRSFHKALAPPTLLASPRDD